MPDYIKMSQEELDAIIEKHEKWLSGDPDGERAELSGFMFDRLDLSSRNLTRIVLRNCHFRMCNITKSRLIDSDFTESDFRFCDLSFANMRGCSMHNTGAESSDFDHCDFDASDMSSCMFARCSLLVSSFRGSNLTFTRFLECSLYECVFGHNDMSHSKFKSCDIDNIYISSVKNFPYIPMTCPETGSFVAWKKANGLIVKLKIPEDARRSSATGRKCRCDKAFVVAIENIDGTPSMLKEVTSNYDENFVYRVGEMVNEITFSDDRFRVCARGIHFFMTRQEAVEY